MAADSRAPSRAAAPMAHDAAPGDAGRDDRTLDLFGGVRPGAKPSSAARGSVQPERADVDERQRSFEGFDWPAGDARETGGADAGAAVQWPAHDADGTEGGATAHGAGGDVTAAGAQAAAGSDVELDSRAVTPQSQHAAAPASERADDPRAAQAAGAFAAPAGDAGRDVRATARDAAAQLTTMPGEREPTSASVDPAVSGARAEADISLRAGRPAIDAEAAAAGSESSARRQTASAPRTHSKRAKSEPKSPGRRGAPAALAPKRRAADAAAKPEPAIPSPESESRAASGSAASGTASASHVAAAAASASASLSGDQTPPAHESAAPGCDPPGTPPCAAPDIDTHLRPLADKLRVLQTEISDMRRAADAQRRRVNRLLLGLGVIGLLSIAGLIVQSMQASRLRSESVALQQRIDRLVAEQISQQASLVTLSQRLDEQGGQVGRLTNRLAGAAKPVKRPYHGR
ncbi:hypothetical protein WS67_03915 [Burkholderia singularis]|uniref:Flagellar hook-length control protein FliK n=2 Tax=Burkholderia singularis TaxID=1503053 RepID=A0A124P9Y9_9BURK|nr:hypothetical protein WS67_03915 [Burkholderia singularis]